MGNLLCADNDAVRAAKAADPDAGLAACRGPACDRYRDEYPYCVNQDWPGWPDERKRKR